MVFSTSFIAGSCVPSLKIEKKVLSAALCNNNAPDWKPGKGAKSVSVESENNAQLWDEVKEIS